MDAHEPEIVVLGAGFAGLHVVRGLAGRQVHVTVVDQHNFHTFQPLLYQVATAGLESGDVAYPIRAIFGRWHNVSVRHATVTQIDVKVRQVVFDDGTSLGYDHLVVASGARANFFGIDGASANSIPLYTLPDARRLRDRLLLAIERAEPLPDRVAEPLQFVIVGGGPTGIETAGAVAELLDVCRRRDRIGFDVGAAKVVLLDVSPRLLGGFPASASDYAIRSLAARGIEVRLGEAVASVTDRGVTLASGENVPASVVVWAAGVTAVGTLADLLGTHARPDGRIPVSADLSVLGTQGVWAVGDVAAIPGARGEGVLPQLAPVAIQSGHHCAQQILRVVDGQRTQPFAYFDKGIMATIGRNSAVAKLPHVPLIKGRLGWLAWLGLHLFYLVGFRNRLRVFINWTWRYFNWPSGPRLIMGDLDRRS